MLENRCAEHFQKHSSRGITTGYNEAFIVGRATRDALINRTLIISRGFKTVPDDERYKTLASEAARQMVDFANQGIDIDVYPAIKKHLKRYNDALKNDQESRNGMNSKLLKGIRLDLSNRRCLYPDLASATAFAFDDEGYYVGSPASLLSTNELWILGVLNTKAVSWFYARTSPQIRGPFLKFTPRYVSQIPIPDMEQEQKSLIHKLLNIFSISGSNRTTDGKDLANSSDYGMVAYFGNIVDGLVYELYLPDELHRGDKDFFQPLFDEQLPQLEDIEERNGDKMPAFRDIFERLYNKHHPVARNLFFLDSVQSIRIIESKA